MNFAGLLLVAFVSALSAADGANILGVFPVNGRSHWVVYESLMKALVARGHNVTVITSFPQKTPVANYTDIDVSKTFPTVVNSVNFNIMIEHLSSLFVNQRFISEFSMKLCRESQRLPQVKALLKSDIKFDAVNINDFTW